MIHNLAADVQAFTSNTFLVTGQQCTLVDTGSNFDVVGHVHDHGSALDRVVITHSHPDHIGNLGAVRDAFDVDVVGFDGSDLDLELDRGLADEQTLQIGDHEYTAYHTPGHARDHLCLHSPATGVCFVGDLVFANGGFGRTDLEGADRDALVDSLKRISAVTDGSLQEFRAGHGPASDRAASKDIERAIRMAQQDN
jgi:glyoxylase-like metal-dependent hydrolase (beta-lactamase superfamily II)